ncbi:15-hydroxyprostaglandin dehydrogenase [NAD(+)]-like [Zerene cesonia]|uniref:15-hydroxyprostaglandin dehydrogenase [NAD(+)]-like n=1 Tax=Zerene cesonia TaxID=33412 RepID=UPI0018E4E15B|nr:15-hydroxyprostaglandin dehydrogenase [NAD(+)]-like [Zerene cesonia]
MCEVKDKICLVTGAASGIGAGIARAFVEKGAKHVAILDINEELGEQLAKELNTQYGENKAKFYKCDVTTDELDAAFDETVKTFGYLDVIVNNAGVMNDSPSVYLKAININVTALIRGSLKAYHLMRKDKDGRGGTIVNISSIVGLMQSFLLPVYSATKSAVLQFSNCLGAEQNYTRTGVRVVTVCFGTTETNLIAGTIGAIDETLEAYISPAIAQMPSQGVDNAVRGLITAFEEGKSGSTWLVTSERPAENISENVKKSYEHLSKGVFN